MILILKNILDTTRIHHIEDFIAPALVGGFLKKSGQIESLTIKKIDFREQRIAEHNAIVDIKPDVVAKRVVKLLNRKRCHGKCINIAEYVIRYRHNDRRSVCQPFAHNLRKADRRRLNMQVTDITQERIGHTRNNLKELSSDIGANPFDNSFKI
jgi:hypothetical protein